MYVRYYKAAKTHGMYICAIVCVVRRTLGLEQSYGRYVRCHNAAKTHGIYIFYYGL